MVKKWDSAVKHFLNNFDYWRANKLPSYEDKNMLACRRFYLNKVSYYNTVNYVTKPPKPEIPINPLQSVYSATHQKSNGIIYDKKPFKITLEAGKTYHWCLCGRSKSQPLCDGTHKDIYLKVPQRPVRFTVEKTKDYWLCNCKQTKLRPFCDGAHKQKEIMEAHVKV